MTYQEIETDDAFEAFKKYEAAQKIVQMMAMANTSGLDERGRFEASRDFEKAQKVSWEAYCNYQKALEAS